MGSLYLPNLLPSVIDLIVDYIFNLLKCCFQPSLFGLFCKYGGLCKILGSVMKWDTSETYYPKDGNELFNYFTTTLKTSCKIFPILFAGSYSPLKSLCAFLIFPSISNLASLVLIFVFTCFPYQMSSGEFILIDFLSELSSADDSSIEPEIDSSSNKSR